MKIRLSHSAMERFHLCERLFQLERLLAGGTKQEDTAHTIFGKAVGVGVASYLLSGNIDEAMFKTWLAYYPKIEDAPKKKTLSIALNMVKVAVSQMDTLREDWDVAEFKGKPAIELSFRLDIPTEGHEIYYVGYIDVVLRNRWTNRYAVLDAKTTGLKLFDVDPLYKNSTQLIGYSTAIDQIVGQEQAEYDVLYLVGQLPEDTGFFPKIHTLTYAKKLSDRLDFFISLGLDVERLARMLELNSFPRRGGNCLQFFKPCREFGTCHLHAAEFYQDADEEDIEYDFRFSLDDVITDHVARIASLPPSPSVEQESNADGDLISLT